RVNTSAVGLLVDSSANRQAAFVSLPSAGRMTERCGIARNDANCSTGSCVGPSSPTAIESCVNTYVTGAFIIADRSEEHTSELQSRFDLVCRLLLEKKDNRRA